jgi:hypothetical protein
MPRVDADAAGVIGLLGVVEDRRAGRPFEAAADLTAQLKPGRQRGKRRLIEHYGLRRRSAVRIRAGQTRNQTKQGGHEELHHFSYRRLR